MPPRRTLVENLAEIEDIDPNLAEQFITNQKPHETSRQSRTPAAASKVAPEQREETSVQPAPPPLPPSVLAAAQVTTRTSSSPLTGIGRVPVGARVRTELAHDLKRASLERQLQGIEPNSVQDILEDALELWLLKHGHRK